MSDQITNLSDTPAAAQIVATPLQQSGGASDVAVVPTNASPASLTPRQEHAPIRIPILDEIRAEQMAAVEHERDARREALLASPLSHDEAAAPAHPAFTGLEHTPKTS